MEAGSARRDVEAVLAHVGWVRALAARLARDPADAEDLAQETLLVACSRPSVASTGVRPWLAGVVRNLALRSRRDRARAVARARASAVERAAPASDELASDAELRRLVGEALVDVGEPFRRTLILRYFGGIDADEIARREGIAVATVRTRQKRGLELLRAELDRRHGDRAAWSALFAGLLEPRTVPLASGASIAGGLIAMNTAWKLACVAACAALVVGGWWVLRATSEPLERAPSFAITDARSPLDRSTDAAGARDDALEAVATSRSGAIELARASEPLPTTAVSTTAIEARIVDDSGNGIDGVTLEASELDVHGTSRSDGIVRLEFEAVDAEFVARLTFAKPGLATRTSSSLVKPHGTTHLGDVVLVRSCVVRGTLEDLDGRPIAGSVLAGPVQLATSSADRIRRTGPGYEHSQYASPTVAVGSDGRFEIADATPGVLRVWGAASGRAWTSCEPLELRAGEVREGVVLRLAPLETRDRIEGRVRSPHGEPVAGARVVATFASVEMSSAVDAITDASGSFSLVLHASVPHELYVRDANEHWPAIVVVPVAPGSVELDLRFQEPRVLEIAARDAHGDPVAHFGAVANEVDRLVRGIDLGPLARIALDAHANGVARLSMPTVPFTLEVDAPGYELVHEGPIDPRAASERITVRLLALPGVRGRVIAPGLDLAGTTIQLFELERGGLQLYRDGFRELYGSLPAAEAVADAHGTFVLALRASGRFVLVARPVGVLAQRFASAELGPLDLDARRGADGLELALHGGGAIEGRVLVAPGESAAGRIVAFNHGDGKPFTLRTDADGRFRAERLCAGSWEVVPANEEIVPSRSVATMVAGRDVEIDWSCEVRAGETTRFDVDARAQRSGRLSGQLVLRGASAEGWVASLEEMSEGSMPTAAPGVPLGPDGSFMIPFARAGTFGIVLTAPGEPGSALTLHGPLELAPGEATWRAEVALTRASGRLGASASRDVSYRARCSSELFAGCGLDIDDSGRFELAHVVVGDGEIGRASAGDGSPHTWVALARFRAEAGVEAIVDVP